MTTLADASSTYLDQYHPVCDLKLTQIPTCTPKYLSCTLKPYSILTCSYLYTSGALTAFCLPYCPQHNPSCTWMSFSSLYPALSCKKQNSPCTLNILCVALSKRILQSTTFISWSETLLWFTLDSLTYMLIIDNFLCSFLLSTAFILTYEYTYRRIKHIPWSISPCLWYKINPNSNLHPPSICPALWYLSVF